MSDPTKEDIVHEYAKKYTADIEAKATHPYTINDILIACIQAAMFGYDAALSKLKEAHDWGYEKGIDAEDTLYADDWNQGLKQSFAEFMKK